MRDPLHDERFASDVRWPGVVADRLGARFHVIEEGLPGRTTVHDDAIEGASRNGKTYLLPCLGSHKPLDGIVLALGTNDLKTRFSLTPMDVRRGLEALLEVIVQSRCGRGGATPRLLIVAPAPIEEVTFLGEIFTGGAAKSRQIAGKYAEVAREHGAEFVDAGSVIVVSPTDGVHFEADQHVRLGTAVAEALARTFAT
jgi:lysophospholipase L1-like esterase